MEIKANQKEQLLEKPEEDEIEVEEATVKTDFFKKASLGIAPSIISEISSPYTKMGMSLVDMQSTMTRSLELGIKPSLLSGVPISSLGRELELSKFQSTVIKAANLGIDPSLLVGVVSTYQNTILDSGLIKGEFTLSESLRIANRLTDEIQNGANSFEETSPSEYTDEQIQFIVKSLENWLNGSISLKNTLQKIKGSKWAFAFVQTVVFTTAIHLFNIFLIIDDYQIQQDRKTLESVETYLETSVLTYKLYKNIINQEKLNTFHPAGFTRTDTYLRKGTAKTAPVIPNGFVGQKTLVLMLDRKNNWRRVEVKINGTYLQGWVPESTIIRLKQNDS